MGVIKIIFAYDFFLHIVLLTLIYIYEYIPILSLSDDANLTFFLNIGSTESGGKRSKGMRLDLVTVPMSWISISVS